MSLSEEYRGKYSSDSQPLVSHRQLLGHGEYRQIPFNLVTYSGFKALPRKSSSRRETTDPKIEDKLSRRICARGSRASKKLFQDRDLPPPSKARPVRENVGNLIRNLPIEQFRRDRLVFNFNRESRVPTSDSLPRLKKRAPRAPLNERRYYFAAVRDCSGRNFNS